MELTPRDPSKQQSEPILLRPHHLLCTQGYSGKGYDAAFVEHIDRIVHRLRTEEATPIRLTFSTDELCSRCPNKLGEDHCSTNEKVKAFDAKTAECFHLEEKTYIYQDLVKEIQKNATPEMMDYICGDCQWAPISSCKKNITGK